MRSQSLTLRTMLAAASMGLAGRASGGVVERSEFRADSKGTPSLLASVKQGRNPDRAARRAAIKAAGGIRQYKRQRQAEAQDHRWGEIAD